MATSNSDDPPQNLEVLNLLENEKMSPDIMDAVMSPQGNMKLAKEESNICTIDQ